MFNEFPKGLFLGGKPDGECKIAMTSLDEDGLRRQGFISIGESSNENEAPKKRGRKTKEPE